VVVPAAVEADRGADVEGAAEQAERGDDTGGTRGAEHGAARVEVGDGAGRQQWGRGDDPADEQDGDSQGAEHDDGERSALGGHPVVGPPGGDDEGQRNGGARSERTPGEQGRSAGAEESELREHLDGRLQDGGQREREDEDEVTGATRQQVAPVDQVGEEQRDEDDGGVEHHPQGGVGDRRGDLREHGHGQRDEDADQQSGEQPSGRSTHRTTVGAPGGRGPPPFGQDW
jgi:hypothetical protein